MTMGKTEFGFRVVELEPEFSRSDIDMLPKLLEQLVPGTTTTPEDMVSHLKEQTINTHEAVFVAREIPKDKLIGMAAVHLVRKTLSYEARLEDVVVDGDYRGSGIARTLVSACIDWAKGKGADHLELTSVSARAEANALYEKMGFAIRETNVRRLDLGGS